MSNHPSQKIILTIIKEAGGKIAKNELLEKFKEQIPVRGIYFSVLLYRLKCRGLIRYFTRQKDEDIILNKKPIPYKAKEKVHEGFDPWDMMAFRD